MREVERVCILGSGEDACELACSSALAGYAVRLFHPAPDAVQGAHARIRALVGEEGRPGDPRERESALGPRERQRALDAILGTSDLDEALTHADLVIDLLSGARDLSSPATPGALARLGLTCLASAVLAVAPDWSPVTPFPCPGRLVDLRILPPPAGEAPRWAGARLELSARADTSSRALALLSSFVRRIGGARGAAGDVAGGGVNEARGDLA